jgi:hypothetical protein
MPSGVIVITLDRASKAATAALGAVDGLRLHQGAVACAGGSETSRLRRLIGEVGAVGGPPRSC